MARVLLEFVVDNKGAITQINKVDKGLGGVDGAAKKAGKGMTGLSTALKAAGAAFAAMGIARFLKGATEAAAEQQRTFTTLAVSMKNVGVSYNEVGKELQGTLAALQATTRYGDTDTAKMLNRLITLTGDYSISIKMLRPIMDMAVSRNEDWKTVSDAIGKAIAGNISTLSRYGIILDEATKKMLQNATTTERADYFYGLLNERFGGAAQADVQTYAGQMEKLGNYWGDFVETVGSFVTTAPGIGSAFSGIITAIELMNEGLIAIGRWMRIAWDTKHLKWFQGELKLLEHKYMMFVANVMDKTQHLPEWMGGGKASQDAGIGAIILAMQAYDEGMALIAEATDDAIEAGDKWEATVRNQITAVTGLAGSPDAAVDKATDSHKKLRDELSELSQRASTALFAALEQEAAAVAELQADLDEMFEAVTGVLYEVIPKGPEAAAISAEFEKLAVNLGAILTRTLGDALYLAFTGRFDEIGDAFAGFFDQIAGTTADSISTQLTSAFGAGGDGQVDWKAVGSAAVGGIAAGVASQGMESGNVAQAAIGGAIAGFMTTGNWVGAVAGAVMGIYGALSAPDSSPPTSRVQFGSLQGQWSGSFQTTGQDISDQSLQNIEQRAYAAYSEMRQRYFNVLRTFGDQGLFDLIRGGGHGLISEGITTGTIDEVLRVLIETELPAMFDRIFAEAFRTGLGDLGLSDEAFDALSAELGMLAGEDRLQALETYVGSLVNLTHLAADMDWNAIMDVVGLDAMGQFMLGLEAISEAVDVQMMGLDSMTMLERANQAQTIEQMISEARMAEIQMLRQIQQIQDSITQSWGRFDEGILLGGMNEDQQLNYYQEQANAMLAALQGATTLEDIQFYNAELMRYLQAIQGLGVGSGTTNDWMSTTTWDEWLLGMSAAAQEASTAALDNMRDDIREANAELVEVLRELIAVLTSPGFLGDDTTGDNTGGGLDPVDVDETRNIVVLPPPVQIHIYNTGAVRTAVQSNSPIN